MASTQDQIGITPEQIGPYVIHHSIGEGAMASVFEAHHIDTHEPVALKLIHPHVAKSWVNEERFRREAELSRKINHPGIVKVHDAGRDTSSGRLYIAMELLEGETLEHRLRTSDYTLLEQLELIIQLLEPLGVAHEKGIVHRDLKPANIFLCQDDNFNEYVKILDFGIARDTTGGHATLTQVGLGTPHYMAPEQATEARRVTTAADVWSVGIMLYFILARRLPFQGEGSYDIVVKACVEPHTSLQDIIPGIDPRFSELIDRCLFKAPEARPQDATALKSELQKVLHLAPPQTSAAVPLAKSDLQKTEVVEHSLPTSSKKASSSTKIWWGGIAGLVAIAATVIGWLTFVANKAMVTPPATTIQTERPAASAKPHPAASAKPHETRPDVSFVPTKTIQRKSPIQRVEVDRPTRKSRKAPTSVPPLPSTPKSRPTTSIDVKDTEPSAPAKKRLPPPEHQDTFAEPLSQNPDHTDHGVDEPSSKTSTDSLPPSPAPEPSKTDRPSSNLSSTKKPQAPLKKKSPPKESSDNKPDPSDFSTF